MRAHRFWRKVETGPESYCWPWLGRQKAGGYGEARIPGSRSSVTAHRVAWHLSVGQIPRGMHVLHRCDNRLCCNPAHLFLGTNLDNIADRHAKGRSAHGTRNGQTRLHPTDVAKIRRLRGEGCSIASMARSYGMSETAIRQIVQGKTWAHLASGGR